QLFSRGVTMRKTVLVLTVVLSGLFLATVTPRADQPLCYTLASVEGSWTIVGTFGANVAKSIGTRNILADGSFTGTFLLNGPTAGSATGVRTITTGTQIGTYAVNCDGTGAITRIVTASNGTQASQIDDFVITRAEVRRHELIATALEDVQRVPSALVAGGV